MSITDTLGIHIQTVSATKVILALPITDALKQPFGVVHGGVNAILAEEAASRGALTTVDGAHVPVGVDINVHHFQAAQTGTLVATATPLFIGNNMQTWQVDIKLSETLTSSATVTLAIKLKHKRNGGALASSYPSATF